MASHGKSAGACHNCLTRKARWYCSADEAFLCKTCDSSVHSANPFAGRHSRVRLEAAAQSWHHGFIRKYWTPRLKKPAEGKTLNTNPSHQVPEFRGEEPLNEENEEQLLYRVPVLDHFLAEYAGTDKSMVERKELPEFDMDLAEFAAQVQCLLDDEELSVFGCDVKPKLEVQDVTATDELRCFLKLDIDGVVSVWNSRRRPWFIRERPGLKYVDVTPEFIGTKGRTHAYRRHVLGHTTEVAAAATVGEGREARVLRYREKRRTRLFAKTIRYEVRKLNAKKRPRMKGRFVKPAAFEVFGVFHSTQHHDANCQVDNL